MSGRIKVGYIADADPVKDFLYPPNYFKCKLDLVSMYPFFDFVCYL